MVRAGSGALGASGVDGREVRNNLGFAVWANAGETTAGKAKLREINRMAASDVGPDGRKVISVKSRDFHGC